jgi:hypothetical protein
VGDGAGNSPPSPPPPPAPPPMIVDVRSLPGGDAVDGLLPLPVAPTDRRGNPDPVPAGQPPRSRVIGACDRCGKATAGLVVWRVQLGDPPQMIVRGVCAACSDEAPH